MPVATAVQPGKRRTLQTRYNEKGEEVYEQVLVDDPAWQPPEQQAQEEQQQQQAAPEPAATPSGSSAAPAAKAAPAKAKAKPAPAKAKPSKGASQAPACSLRLVQLRR